METTDHNIRIKPVNDIQYAFMGTTGYADPLLSLLNQKIPFMAKVLGLQLVESLNLQSEMFDGYVRISRSGNKQDPIPQICILIHINKTTTVLQCWIQADITIILIEMGFKNMLAGIDSGGLILRKEAKQAISVIIMTMGNYGCVYNVQSDP